MKKIVKTSSVNVLFLQQLYQFNCYMDNIMS